MPDYLPVFEDGDSFTMQASAQCIGGQLLAVSGSGTVAPCGAGSTAWLGVANYDAITGAKLTVLTGGVQELVASGAITAGTPVISGANGTVAASATPPAGQQIGIAITTAADTAKVRVRFAR